jgi:hypothetical protein
MPKFLQAPCQPSLTATNVDGPAAGRRHNVKELIAVKAPVAIVSRCARPFDPLVGMSFPELTEIHRPTMVSTNAKERIGFIPAAGELRQEARKKARRPTLMKSGLWRLHLVESNSLHTATDAGRKVLYEVGLPASGWASSRRCLTGYPPGASRARDDRYEVNLPVVPAGTPSACAEALSWLG